MSRKLLLGSLALGAGILVLLLHGAPERKYAHRVGDFLASDPSDREVRVRGYLVHGTLCRVSAECGYRFAMADGESSTPSRLSVQYDGCVLPDTFRDIEGLDTPVMVQGQRCETCHDFRASQIFTRSLQKYEVHVDGGLASPAAPPPPLPLPPPLCAALAPRM